MTQPTDSTQIIDGHKLIREGTSQGQRTLETLKPGYVQVDEHHPADWMVFAQRYAEYVQFFDLNNQVAGDWRPFFAKDPSAMLAVAAVQNVDFFRATIAGYIKELVSLTASNDKEETEKILGHAKKTLGHAFNVLGTLAWQLDVLKEALPQDIALKGLLQNIIQSELAQAFERLIACFKAAKDKNVVDYNSNDYDWDILGAKIGPFSECYQNSFTSDWYKHKHKQSYYPITSWADFYEQIPANYSIFGGEIGDFTRIEKLNFAASHNLFTGIFDLFIKAYSRVVTEAAKNLQNTFTGKNDHEPHYALFLAFLRLFEYAREHTNTLTQRHLDFYYKEVLRLKEKVPEPNQAHLIVHLAKHQQSYLLKAGTEFIGGKDSTGKAVIYQLQEDFAANSANVVELKSTNYNLVNDKLYAYPDSNSDDGRGAELTSPVKQWHPFLGKPETDNLAQVGFAIASHYLLLAEGHRKIRLTMTFKEEISQKHFCEAFDFALTATKGWVTAVLDIAPSSLSSDPTNTVEIPLLISGNQPPIVALKGDAHGNNLPAGLPTLRAIFKPENANSLSLPDLQKLTLDSPNCLAEVAVGYQSFTDPQPDKTGTGLKNLYISNQFGEIKPDKPFQPFGPMPEKGDHLIIGSDEVFQKKNAKLQFRVVWKGLPDWRGDIDFDWVNEFAPLSSLTFLKNGIWDTADPDQSSTVAIFNDTRPNLYFPAQKMKLPIGSATEVHFDQQPYTVDSRNGFVKLTLEGDFGHKLYQPTLSRYLIRLAKGEPLKTDKSELWKEVKNANEVYKLENGRYVPKHMYAFKEKFIEAFSQAMPIEPYTPVIESLTLSYTASVKFNEENTALYWLTPFGYKTADVSQKSLTVLPVFEALGEFYLGIKDLMPPQNLSLLFQLAEGSADPTVIKPPAHIKWSYLKNNEWVDFKNSEFSDATAQLTRSGIIRFAMLKDATQNDSLFFATNTYWLRALVRELPDAVCKIITVTAQAALVRFKDQGNAADFLNTQLAENSISKLELPDAAVKKVEQPYPAFGGRPQEASEKFYTRISERLRHKNRSITAWDYEHLILEAFPFIYKVKCLNHTHLEPGANGACLIHNELASGHVTIVTIPNLSNHNAIDRLSPKTSLGDLDLIKQFLEQHVSSFVNLHVHNPIFEMVRTDFKVKFNPGIDVAIHIELLQQEMVKFLSPWAFADGKDVTFGGKIYKSSLIDFVEEQTYVDYVTDFQLFQVTVNPDNSLTDGPNLEEVKASTEISILVSVAAEQHTIDPIPESTSTIQVRVSL